jgi:hypothetical protein
MIAWQCNAGGFGLFRALRACVHHSVYIKTFCKCENFHCYIISGYHSNELLSINMFHECMLCSRSQTIEQSFVSVYLVCSVSIDNMFI